MEKRMARPQEDVLEEPALGYRLCLALGSFVCLLHSQLGVLGCASGSDSGSPLHVLPCWHPGLLLEPQVDSWLLALLPPVLLPDSCQRPWSEGRPGSWLLPPSLA